MPLLKVVQLLPGSAETAALGFQSFLQSLTEKSTCCKNRGMGGSQFTLVGGVGEQGKDSSSLQPSSYPSRCRTAHIEDSGTEYTCFLLQVGSVCYVELTHAESTQNHPALRLRVLEMKLFLIFKSWGFHQGTVAHGYNPST